MTTNTIKTQALVATAWFTDCDPFMSIAFNPSRVSRIRAETIFWSVVQADVRDQWQGQDDDACPSEEDFQDDVRWGGLHAMEVELREDQLEDFGLEPDGTPSGSLNRATGYVYLDTF